MVMRSVATVLLCMGGVFRCVRADGSGRLPSSAPANTSLHTDSATLFNVAPGTLQRRMG
jgi:hypothetical protein